MEAALKYARKATGEARGRRARRKLPRTDPGGLSVTGQPAKRAAFTPLIPAVAFVRPNDVAALRSAVTEDVGLVLLEPILGEGGVHPLDPEFLAAAGELPALVCLDEIQTGVGRTGSFFAFEALGVRPDLVTLPRASRTGYRSAPCWWLITLQEPSPPVTTARPSAATRCLVPQRAPSSTRSTRSYSPTCVSAARSLRQGWPCFRVSCPYEGGTSSGRSRRGWGRRGRRVMSRAGTPGAQRRGRRHPARPAADHRGRRRRRGADPARRWP